MFNCLSSSTPCSLYFGLIWWLRIHSKHNFGRYLPGPALWTKASDWLRLWPLFLFCLWYSLSKSCLTSSLFWTVEKHHEIVPQVLKQVANLSSYSFVWQFIQTSANWGPDSRLVLEAIIKALISKSKSSQVIKLMDRGRVLNLKTNIDSRVP